jgi:uncharacterized protein YjiS (DUF1127 family)
MHAMRPAAGVPARMPSVSEFFSLMGAKLSHALVAVLGWRARSRERAVLATLDDRALQDIGLTRAETWVESGKPFWRC